MTIDGVSRLGSTRSRHGLQRHLFILSVETSPWSYLLKSSLLTVGFGFEWVLGIRSLFLTTLLNHLLVGKWIIFLTYRCFFGDLIFRTQISAASNFSKSSRSAIRLFPFQNLPRDSLTAKKDSWKKVLAKLMISCLISWWNRMIFNNYSKRYYWSFKLFSKSSFVRRFPICQEVLDVSQIAIAYPRARPPPFIQT